MNTEPDGPRVDANERRILEAIRMEWRLAWWDLPKTVRERMRTPGFEIREVNSRWGQWLGERRQMILSRRLIVEGSWPCVREVLRHEMAHQMADEVFHVRDLSHGERFREACRMLGADPRASGSLPSIGQWIAQEDAARDPRIEKVRKLMALATSPHAHEAEAAMLKAHEWMTRYNIDPMRKDGREYLSMCVGAPALRHSIADDALAAILRDFYFVETVFVSIIVPTALKSGRILEISGTRENVRMASYVFDFLGRSMAEQVDVRGIHRKRSRKDYAIGFLKGVGKKLEAQRQTMLETAPETAALVKAGDAGLRAYVRERYPRLTTRYRRGRNVDERAYRAGMRDGHRIIIHKPVESGPGGRVDRLTRGVRHIPATCPP